MEELIEEVESNSELFELLLKNVLISNESDAKWQFAVSLGKRSAGQKCCRGCVIATC
jgi:hypothetical protein